MLNTSSLGYRISTPKHILFLMSHNLPNNSMFNTNGVPLRGMGGNSVELQRFER